MSSYDVMAGQAGDRLIIRWKIKDEGATTTSHFPSVEEFLAEREQERKQFGDVLEWYEVDGGKRIQATAT